MAFRIFRAFLVTAAVLLLIAGGTLWFRTRPNYAWLSFGPQERLRVLVCDRGLWITMTQYLDGKKVSPVTRYRDWHSIEGMTLHDPDGQTTYTISDVSGSLSGGRLSQIFGNVKIEGELTYEQYCDLSISAHDAQIAHVAHFHGPLTIGPVTTNWKLPEKLALQMGNMPTTLRSFVGTMDAARGCWVVVSTQEPDRAPRFPDGVRPEVEVVFPSRSAGESPIIERFTLDQVCCGCVFYGPQPVPDSAGEGRAKVTFSFPTWTAARIAPTTIHLPVTPAAAENTPAVAQIRVAD